MSFAAFFDTVPTIRLRDGLAQLLGASDDGIIEYRYADAVRLAGHSCPTVAGAWLCARAGLRHLYGDAVPERGGIRVTFPEREDAGVTGVIAQVLTLITGAAGANGFKGLGGQHARNGLLQFDVSGVAGFRMQRMDTGASVDVEFDTGTVPPNPAQRQFIPLILGGQADDEQRREFGRLWQDRVRRMLTEHADDPAMVHVREVARAA